MALQILRMLATCTPEFCYQILGVITDVPETDDAILKESSLEEVGGSGRIEETLTLMKQKGLKGRALSVMGMIQITSLLTPSPEQRTKQDKGKLHLTSEGFHIT